MTRPWRLRWLALVLTAAVTVACGDTRAPGGPSPEVSGTTVEGSGLAIAVQPQSQSVPTGGSATLTVAVVGGAGARSYQWYVGASGNTSSPVTAATAASYTTPSLSATASYWVRVSDATGIVDSATAVLTVTPLTPLSFEHEVLVLVNERRAAGATCGDDAYPPVGPLSMHAQLQASARGHSQDMAAQDFFSHTSLDGRTFVDRIRATGYTASPIGENIAAGYQTPQAVMAGWMNSPGHCRNIMSAGYRGIGVGYAFTTSTAYRHYWTQNFGGR